jgi:hypothetical protein
MNPELRQYLSEIGRRGGLKSRRTLAPETARAMSRVRDARRAFRRFHTQCFGSYDPSYRVGMADIEWVADQLMAHGDREARLVGARLRG